MPVSRHSRRALLRLALASAGAGLASGCVQALSSNATAPRLELLAHGFLPPLGATFEGMPVGGLSALAYNPEAALWYALSDARGRHGALRCFTFRLAPFTSGGDIVPQWQSVIRLRDADGAPLHSSRYDPEGLALAHDPANGATALFWSSEGNILKNVVPAIYAAAPDGTRRRAFELPPLLRELGHEGRGPQNNRTLEGIALTPDGRHLWAAMEGALLQDETGDEHARQSGPRRLTCFDVASGRASHQVAYLPDALPESFTPNFARVNGISDVLVASDDELWVLERAFTLAIGFRVRLYAAELGAASDTLGRDALRPKRYTPVRKRLLMDFNGLDLPSVDNLEGMAWGPRLPDGARTLLLVSDDNFSALQRTQFIALRVGASRRGEPSR